MPRVNTLNHSSLEWSQLNLLSLQDASIMSTSRLLLLACRYVLLAVPIHGPLVDVAAVIGHNPRLCCMVAEAALRVMPALKQTSYSLGPDLNLPGAFSMAGSYDKGKAGWVCHAACIMVDFMAEAGAKLLPAQAAGGTAAQHREGSDSTGLQQLLANMFALMTAALKHGLNSAADSSDDLKLYLATLKLLSIV